MRILLIFLLFVTTAHAENVGLQILPVPQKKTTKFESKLASVMCGETKQVLDYLVKEIPTIKPVFSGTTSIGEKPVQLYREPVTGAWFFLYQEGSRTCSVGGGDESVIIVSAPFTSL
tara:strand:+ start:2286 stop:2636 length:351 start_codon:yes stop_codon:yes gene_type:complete